MSKKGFGKFLLGAGVGASLGLLFAPKKGTETRKELKEKYDELVIYIKNIDKEELKDNIMERIDALQAEINDLDKEKVLKIVKEKAKVIKKKADELVEYAVKKGTPTIEKLAEDARVKTIDLLTETIARLEKKEKKAEN